MSVIGSAIWRLFLNASKFVIIKKKPVISVFTMPIDVVKDIEDILRWLLRSNMEGSRSSLCRRR